MLFLGCGRVGLMMVGDVYTKLIGFCCVCWCGWALRLASRLGWLCGGLMAWLVECRGLMVGSVMCELDGLVAWLLLVVLASRGWLCGLFGWLSFL